MKPYLVVTAVLFAAFAVFHVYELVQGLRAPVPDHGMMIAVAAIVMVSASLAFWAFRLLRLGKPSA